MQSITLIERQFIAELGNLYDDEEVRQLCYLLFEDRFGWSKSHYLLNRQTVLHEQDTLWLTDVLAALKTAKPIQYILGYAWFMGMKLAVNEAVLIPRPETEELVQRVIERYQKSSTFTLRILDIGTGSGCIAIALKRAFPSATVYALDISADALHVARRNAADQSVDIQFVNADILEWEMVFDDTQTFDVVVSNPPYITAAEQHEMHKNVLAYEPHLALFVEDHTPLLFYERIAAFGQKHLAQQGGLYVEINRRYGRQVTELLRKKGFADVQVYRDIHGADRVVHAKKANNQSDIMK